MEDPFQRLRVSRPKSQETRLSPLARLAASSAAKRRERSVRGPCFSAEGGAGACSILANTDPPGSVEPRRWRDERIPRRSSRPPRSGRAQRRRRRRPDSALRRWCRTSAIAHKHETAGLRPADTRHFRNHEQAELSRRFWRGREASAFGHREPGERHGQQMPAPARRQGSRLAIQETPYSPDVRLLESLATGLSAG